MTDANSQQSQVTNSGRLDRAAGFTVVETMIVLAIAGLILLIILLAIPMLQRTSRNNQRKQDVQSILEAVSRYALNNAGNFINCGHDGTNSCSGSGNLLGYSHMTYYTDDNQVQMYVTKSGQTVPAPADSDTVYVYNHQKCDTDSAASTPQGAGYGDVVALYALQTSDDVSWHCQQL